MSKSELGTELEELVIEEEESGDDSDMRGVDQGKQILPLEEGPQLRGELESFQEVQSHKEKDCWKNDTYEFTELPKRRKTLNNKWVFKLKNDDEKLLKDKAHLMVKGFDQKQDIDFDEIFSPVVKMCLIRILQGLAASMNLELEQLDVKTAFLHGDPDEKIFMEQPEGFKVKGKENMACKLKKILYGLKQTP